MDRSLASRIGVGNDSVLNVRDDVQDDDEDFFHGSAYEAVQGEDKENYKTSSSASPLVVPGNDQQPPATASSAVSSNRYSSNLSKISESPDEFSYSFKHGEKAVQLLNHDHEEMRHRNFLRLPSTSFHASRYSMKHSWEESALRLQNATLCSFARPELDLSKLNVTNRKHPQLRERTTADFSAQFGQSSNATDAQFAEASSQFLSGSRHTIYFGFCRLGFESEQTLILRNRHPRGERVQIRCGWRRRAEERDKHFRILQPRGTGEDKEHTQILAWEQAAKVVIAFTPPASAYYKNFLCVECKSREEMREYYFLVHGYGGRAVVEPSMEGRSANLCFSTNGQYQLIVRSALKFRFSLKNCGQRSAFATLLFYYANGVEVPSHEIGVNMHNLLLSKEGCPEPSSKVIEVRFFGTKCASSSQSVASNSPDSVREISLKIAIIWGEEKQRQRLKRFEKREINLREELKNFGLNFTTKRNFDGERVELEEPNISEEEFYCFEKQARMTFVNIIERSNAAMAVERCSSAGSLVPTYQQRAGSALSVVSGGTEGRRELRAHQTIVEMDPDNTLTVGGANVLEDDTLT
uniref:Uncharacterized protein n=1 Tax=Globodera rostochiensis TaxID=31243 RepID=A0A914IAS8_GLORO